MTSIVRSDLIVTLTLITLSLNVKETGLKTEVGEMCAVKKTQVVQLHESLSPRKQQLECWLVGVVQ